MNSDPTPPSEAAPDQSPGQEPTLSEKGAVLRREREAKGITLEMVHEVTKIPLDVLRAIEQGYTVRTITPFYYRGFVKIYAQYLDIDLKKVFGEDYKPFNNVPKYFKKDVENFQVRSWTVKTLSPARKQQFITGAWILVLLFIILKVGSCVTRKPASTDEVRGKVKMTSQALQPKSSAQAKTAVKSTPVVPALNVSPKTQTSAKKKEDTVNLKPAPVVSSGSSRLSSEIQKEMSKEGAGPSAGSASLQPSSEEAGVKTSRKVMLTVRALQNSWLQVKADGVTVFQSTLNRGAVETWLAREKIELAGKNLHQLEFEANGKMIGTLGRNDRRAKMLVITKDGLSVTK